MGGKASSTHNLPYPVARFIGREKEIADIRKLLSEIRMLTLTGIGGSGKTRLAIQTASQLIDEYPNGLWLVELSEISDPSFVLPAIVAALRLHKEPGKPLIETIMNVLKPGPSLLIFDNCEHLIDVCARLSQTLLFSCPQLKILATSREPIRIAGEVSWQVLPLSLPETDLPISPRDALQYSAIELFVDRARSVLPTFSITSQNVSEIVRVCRYLEGIPLALEFAASWINTLSLSQISKRLSLSLQLLVHGNREVPARQQTMRAALDWSYDLLSQQEKVLFQRLALFYGDFSLNAAEEICSGNGLEEYQVVSLLSQLVSKSLLNAIEKESQEKRFQLHEIVRQYSLEKLKDSQEEGWLVERFLNYYLTLAKKAKVELYSLQQGKWVTILEQERNHFRAAIHISQEEPVWYEKGLQLASALTQFWQLRGYLSEGSKSLENLLACSYTVPDRIKADALSSAGFLAYFLEDYDRCKLLTEEARVLYLKLGDDFAVAEMINNLASNAEGLEDYAEAKSLAGLSYAMCKEMDDAMGMAVALFCLGEVAFLQKDMGKAVSSFEESLELCRKSGNQWAMGRRLARLGQFSCLQGDTRQAQAYLAEGLAMAGNAGDKWGMTMILAGMAELSASLGQMERSTRLLAGSDVIIKIFSTQRRPVDQILYENCAAMVKMELGEQAYQAISQEMHAKSLEQILEFAFADPAQTNSRIPQETFPRPIYKMSPLQEVKAKYGGLTARELEVATLVAHGKRNAAIAEELFVEERTVEAHISHILTKLNFSSRTEIVSWVIHKGLTPL